MPSSSVRDQLMATLPSAPLVLPAVPVAARRQGGVFTAAQARAEGWTDRTIRRRIVKGRWLYVAGRALAEPSEIRFALAASGRRF